MKRRRRRKHSKREPYKPKPITESCRSALNELYASIAARFPVRHKQETKKQATQTKPVEKPEERKEDEIMNYVELIGNLTRDPVVRYTKTGTPVASFCVAVNRKYIDKYGQEQTLSDFINAVAWDRLGNAVGTQLKKGDRVHIVGRLSTRTYDDKDGKKVYVTEVNANAVSRPLDIRTENGGYNAQNYGGQSYGGGYNQNHGGGYGGQNGGYGGQSYGAPANSYGGGGNGFQKFGQPVQNGQQNAQQGTQAEQEEIPF